MQPLWKPEWRSLKTSTFHWTYKCQICQQQRPTPSSQYDTIPVDHQVISHLPGGKLIREEAALCSYWNKHLLWTCIMYVLSLHTMLHHSCHPRIYRMPHPWSWYSTYIACDQEITLQQISVTMGPCPWNSLILSCFTSSWSNWHNRTVEYPFEVLECQLSGKNIQGMGNVLQKVIYALNQHPIFDSIFSIATIYKSRNQEMEMRVGPLTITCSWKI